MASRRTIRAAQIAAVGMLLWALLDGVWLLCLWPNWKPFAHGPVPRSRFLRDWEARSGRKAQWSPIPFAAIPQKAIRAVLLAEDAGFWGHDGFDMVAFREAMSENVSRGHFAFGGSTISQQTAKNLFLTPSRTPVRKWHEAVLTWGMERNLSKRRILEIYLNDVELGEGIFGLEAAAEAYYAKGATDLTQAQAIELAATLPSPRKDNPRTRTRRFVQRTETIAKRHQSIGELDLPRPAEGTDVEESPGPVDGGLRGLEDEVDRQRPEDGGRPGPETADTPGAAASVETTGGERPDPESAPAPDHDGP